VIDFKQTVKNDLINMIMNLESRKSPHLEDNYNVKIMLKNSSTYAYASRKFAYKERLQIREIIDDLLKRDIIKVSNFPYCARVVPIRKRSGNIRLCVDLCPLNARVIKQKYPFPVMKIV
jgi:hypothetical protein